MKTTGHKMQSMGLSLLLCSTGYANPIDGPTTETVTNLLDLGSANLQIGLTTDGNAMIITNGGSVVSGSGNLGTTAGVGSQSNRVAVTGIGSTWINSGSIYLGSKYNELLITDGGRVDSTSGTLGGYNGYRNRVIVNGTGSIWSNSAGLSLSSGGVINGDHEMIVTNGGHLYSNGGTVGKEGSYGTRLVVTDPGSVYKNAGGLFVGYYGELLVANGGRVENTEASFYFGSANVTGAGSTWVNSGNLRLRGLSSVTVSNGGTVSASSFTLSDTDSAFHLQTGGKLAVSGNFDAGQSGTFDFTGGTLSVGGTLTNLSMLAADCHLEAADLSGDLTVHGTFVPGQSPADTMLDGAFVLAGDGTIEMELAGYLLGTEYDRLTVTGESMLDGTLAVVLLDDYSPVYGVSFDLFNWNEGVSGTFAATNLPTLENGLFWDTGSLYTDGTVTVVPEPSTALLLGMGLTAFGVYALRNKVYEF